MLDARPTTAASADFCAGHGRSCGAGLRWWCLDDVSNTLIVIHTSAAVPAVEQEVRRALAEVDRRITVRSMISMEEGVARALNPASGLAPTEW